MALVLDQSSSSGANMFGQASAFIYADWNYGQRITVGVTGTLDRIDVDVNVSDRATEDLTATVLSEGGLELGTASVTALSLLSQEVLDSPARQTIVVTAQFTFTGISVTAGDVLEIRLSTGHLRPASFDYYYGWNMNTAPNAYSRGDPICPACVGAVGPFAFRAYVETGA